jgi:Predicted Zn-dependent hydrolases of the beta-lactamase fold
MVITMEDLKIRALGVGAAEIKMGTKRILVDAFNSNNEAEELKNGDFILFTHDDLDHFMIESFPNVKNLDVVIIGPPSIVKPLLESDKASSDQIKVMFSGDNNSPVNFEFDGFLIKSFATPHFLKWKPIHNSYLVETEGYKLYITGDSYLTVDMQDKVEHIDYVICNLVDQGFITHTEDSRFAIHHHLSYLLRIISDFKPKKIVGMHLLNFDGTVNASDMKKLIEAYQFEDILIPSSKEEIISLT